MWQLSGFYNIL